MVRKIQVLKMRGQETSLGFTHSGSLPTALKFSLPPYYGRFNSSGIQLRTREVISG